MTLQAAMKLRLGELDLDAEIEVNEGEVVALLGPNGSGKTTLLRCLAGLTPIDEGRIAIDGVVVDEPAAAIFIEPEDRSIGFVHQNYLLFDHMTVLENVAYGLRASRMPKANARAIAAGWLDRVGLAQHGSQRPHSLSGGQAQRAALARTLATNPRLLLLDEPLAALDAGTRSTIRRELIRHLETFDGMRILVTHDPVDAYALADRVAIVDAGRIVQTGTLAEVSAHPRSRYVADLVGINLVSGNIRGNVLTTSSGADVVVAADLEGAAFAVVRPNSISLVKGAPQPGSSARNLWSGVIGEVDFLADRARVTIVGTLPLIAEVTAEAVEALQLRPGDPIYATAKATEIDVYPA
jgi:molybdate transport system ATP-binding protein